MVEQVEQVEPGDTPTQLAIEGVGSPLRATSYLRAQYAAIRAQHPPTAAWPDKRCYYVARTRDYTEDGFRENATASDKVSASRANVDPAVKQYIARVRSSEQASDELMYSARQTLQDLWLVTDIALGRAPQKRVVVVQERVEDADSGEVTTTVRAHQLEVEETSLKNALKAIDTWTKHYGLVRERLEADFTTSLSQLSDDELQDELRAYGLTPGQLPEDVPVDESVSVSQRDVE